jgi:hypothetical protein
LIHCLASQICFAKFSEPIFLKGEPGFKPSKLFICQTESVEKLLKIVHDKETFSDEF